VARPRELAAPAGLLELIGVLEAVEGLRQRRRGSARSVVTSESDLDPASVQLLALTWWPAGVAALAVAWLLPEEHGGHRRRVGWVLAGTAVTGGGIALRQWSIATLGRYFVGHVEVQPGQTVVSSGPYRWLRHPSYTGMWLEMTGVGLATANPLSTAMCATVPLIGIARRIGGEERALATLLPGYADYTNGRRRLIPFVW
jgi:protein-S-isoprenylcysteine O-methyltransferase Ste14